LEGQDTTTIYYNSKFKVVKNQNSASYYRKLFQYNDLWLVNDFYSNGILKMTGSFQDNKCTIRQGIFKNYYQSGQLQSVEQYINNKKNGKWIQYFESGIKDYESEYQNDNKTGVWIWYFDNGKIGAREKYKNNIRVKAKYWNKEGEKVEIKDAEYPPTFQGGGLENFKSWVAERVEYPEYLANSQIKGEVRIQFNINPQGEVDDVKIVQSVYSMIDDIVYKVIKSSPKWIPGKLHNREFAYTYEISLYLEYKK
jgi:TonB family protein